MENKIDIFVMDKSKINMYIGVIDGIAKSYKQKSLSNNIVESDQANDILKHLERNLLSICNNLR